MVFVTILSSIPVPGPSQHQLNEFSHAIVLPKWQSEEGPDMHLAQQLGTH